MKYPTISTQQVQLLCADRLADRPVDLHNAIKWEGTEPELDIDPLATAAQRIEAELVTHNEGPDAKRRDLLEGRASGVLHAALTAVPLEVLDDPGFWRYVGFVHLWELVRWRERKTFDRGDWSEYRKYIDGTRPSECVATRMFLRGRISLIDGDYGLASAVREGTDLWRSHIVRVKTSYSPTLARELVRQVSEHSVPTDDLREMAKRINRLASNVMVHLYDADVSQAVLDEIRPGEVATTE